MRKVFILIIFVFGLPLWSETDSTEINFKNAISLNFDSGSVFTYLSIERCFISSGQVGIIGQLGLGSIPFVGGYSFPHKLIVSIPSNRYVSLELGAGGNYWMKDFDISVDSYYLYPLLGVRIDSDYNLLVRVTFSPYIRIYGEDFFEGYSFPPLMSLSAGYLF